MTATHKGALAAIREALTLPYAATADGDKVRDRIFENRLMYVTSFLDDVLGDGPHLDLDFEIRFLVEGIAKHAPVGYVTDVEARAALARGATWTEAVTLPIQPKETSSSE